MPSRPVLEPTIIIGLPSPLATAEAMRSVWTIPTAMALTRGLPVYDSSKYTSPATVGTPNELP